MTRTERDKLIADKIEYVLKRAAAIEEKLGRIEEKLDQSYGKRTNANIKANIALFLIVPLFIAVLAL